MIFITEKQIRNRQAVILRKIGVLTSEYSKLQSLLSVPRERIMELMKPPQKERYP